MKWFPRSNDDTDNEKEFIEIPLEYDSSKKIELIIFDFTDCVGNTYIVVEQKNNQNECKQFYGIDSFGKELEYNWESLEHFQQWCLKHKFKLKVGYVQMDLKNVRWI